MFAFHERLLAEFIGTGALIFLGAGAAATGIGGLAGAAFAHGFIVIGMIYAIGAVSGCHINPAVTTGLLIAGEIETKEAAAYISTQLLGAVVAALLLAISLGGTTTGLGATVLAEGLLVGDQVIDVGPFQGFFLEVIGTFFLVFAVFTCAVAGRAGSFAPIAIGMTLMAAIFFIGPLTGAGFNPARTLGPAIVSGIYADLWLYIIGPVTGAALAALAHKALSPKKGA